MATVAVSVISLTWTHAKDRQLQIEQEHRAQVIPIYQKFIKFWFDNVNATKLGKPQPSEVESLEFFVGFTEDIILWGSDKVIAEYVRFRKNGQNVEPAPATEGSPDQSRVNGIALMLGFENLLLAMRADVGHKNEGLKPGDISSTFINDLEAYIGDSNINTA